MVGHPQGEFPMTTPQAPRKPLQAVLGCFGMLMLAAVGVVAAGRACTSSSGGPHDWTAISTARDSVKQRLVSPGSAKFPAGLSRIAARSAEGKYLIVYVAVDSQNGFGALLRSECLVLLLDSEGSMLVLHAETFTKSPTVQDVRRLTEEVGDGWQIEPWLQ